VLIISSKQSLNKADKANVAKRALAGERIMVWFGERRDCPSNWVSGKACLRIKVGKHRKIVKGMLEEDTEGCEPDGRDTFSFYFVPTRPRVSKMLCIKK
jgi:hypothetical protein